MAGIEILGERAITADIDAIAVGYAVWAVTTTQFQPGPPAARPHTLARPVVLPDVHRALWSHCSPLAGMQFGRAP